MDNIAKPRIGKAGVCMSEKIKSKKDLKDWLKYELDKYDNRGRDASALLPYQRKI